MSNEPLKSFKGLNFSPAQNRVITSCITLLSALLMVVVFAVVMGYVLEGLSYFVHIVGPVIVAFFLSLLTRPWYQRLLSICHQNVVFAVILFSLSVLIPIAIFTWLLGAFFIEQWMSLSTTLPGQLKDFYHSVQANHPKIGALLEHIFLSESNTALVSSDVMNAGENVLGVSIGEAIVSIGSAFLLWLLTFFYWIIFVMQKPLTGQAFAKMLPFLTDKGQLACERYFKNFTEIMDSYFRGQIIDVLIQGVLYGTAFHVLFSYFDLPNGFMLGFVIGLLNLAPYIGVITGICVVTPIAFFHGGAPFALITFLIFCCVQTFDGYIMQPYIQGKRMRLSAWQIVFALLFWTKLGGFLGLLLAIPLTAFLKASWKEWRDHSERFVAMPHPPTDVTKEGQK